MLDYKPIKDASARIRKIIGFSEANILTKSETENLLNATEQVNLFLYQVKKLKFQREYDSPALRLLYFGDMTVDGEGNWCTFDERLADLRKRHGVQSEVYKESYQLATYLRKLGFDDTVHKEHLVETLNLSEIINKKEII